MFYSEQYQSPINSYNVKRIYGVNPDNDPDRAFKIGIYPLTEVPDGYGVSHYEKETRSYTAVPHCVTLQEQEMVTVIRKMGSTLSSLRQLYGLPATAEVPQAVDGYYPLYVSEAEANYNSTNNASNPITVEGATYYMPDEGVTLYNGDYDVAS